MKQSPDPIDAATIQRQPPWHRQFWPWFLLALPTVAVIACMVSLDIALRHGDSPVRDSYRKEGFAISRTAPSDATTAGQDIHAQIAIDGSQLAIVLDGERLVQPAALTLQFIHPFAAARDFALALRQDGADRYTAELPPGTDGRWTVELCEAACARWRLRGALDLRADTPVRLRLQP